MLMSFAGTDVVFWLAVVLCAIAQLFILKAVLFPGPVPAMGPAAEGRAAGRLLPASRPLEIAWAVLPAIALVWMFVWAWQLRHPPDISPATMITAAIVLGGAA